MNQSVYEDAKCNTSLIVYNGLIIVFRERLQLRQLLL